MFGALGAARFGCPVWRLNNRIDTGAEGDAGSDDSGSTSATGETDACVEIDGGASASCAATGDETVCGCDDGFVPIFDGCVSTDVWKLDEEHWIPAKIPMTVVHPCPDEEPQDWAPHRVAHPDFRYEIPLGGSVWR